MNNFAGLSGVTHTSMESISQRKFVIDTFQQNGAIIGATVGLIEGDGDRLVKIFAEKNRLCGKVSHQEASVDAWNMIAFKYLYIHGGFLFYIFHE
jgi:hypothetical protein